MGDSKRENGPYEPSARRIVSPSIASAAAAATVFFGAAAEPSPESSASAGFTQNSRTSNTASTSVSSVMFSRVIVGVAAPSAPFTFQPRNARSVRAVAVIVALPPAATTCSAGSTVPRTGSQKARTAKPSTPGPL